MMKTSILVILLLFGSITHAQIPVEIFGGHERTTVDIMFFRFFKNQRNENSRWLFFNRNRASVDYRMTKTMFMPQFGFTEAISYNHEKLKGFAPVLVGQVLSWGVYAKTGIQYVHIKKDVTIFTWLVCETKNEPDIDYFLLLRYTPKLSDRINLFAQAESINAMPTISTRNFSFTQRLRFGIQLKNYQFGLGADFSQTGNTTFTETNNIGAFLRHEF